MNPEKTRELLKSALITGGGVLMDHLGNSGDAVIKESISSVVTEADLAAERALIDLLTDGRDPFNIISEEAGYRDQGSRWTWVIDPLDGTSNFAASLPWFGVIITLFHDSTPVMAGMYLPVEDQLYLAESGRGVTRNGLPVECTQADDLQEVLVAYSYDFSSDPGKTEAEMKLLARLSRRIRNTRSTNSLVDFCYTVDGRLGAAMNQSTRIWDIAAPWLMIREAGGTVSDIQGNEIVFDLSPGEFQRNYTIVAAGRRIHRPIMDVIMGR